MKYRTEAVGVIVDNRPVGAYFSDPIKAQDWARTISNQHKCYVKIYQTYERILKTIKPTKARALKEVNGKPYGGDTSHLRKTPCVCGSRVFCAAHPEKGFQKGRQ